MQTCAILEPEKESTSKEERPDEESLDFVRWRCPRKDGNSDLLCRSLRGVQESGNEVQKIFVGTARRLCPRMPAITAATTAASVP